MAERVAGAVAVWLIFGSACCAVVRADDTGPRPKEGFCYQRAEPGLSLGKTDDIDLPKTILFSAGPDHIIADAEEWSRRGVRAFFLNFVAREWSSDIWARDGKPWTIGASDETFQKAKKANEICRRIGSETFLKVAFDHPFEWFNDLAWQRIDNNFKQFALFARHTGCTGIALDIEYVGEQYAFDWEGYDYRGYTRKDLVKKIRERMTRVIQVLYDAFPDMVFLTLPEEGLSLGSHIHAAWVEEAARRDALGGIHYCTETTYIRPNIRYMFGHAWACNDLFHRILSERARRYWVKRCSIAAGVWPFGADHSTSHAPQMSLDAFRQGIAGSLMMSRRYNWLYSHQSREQLIGRELDAYKGDADLRAYHRVIAKREVVTTPKYVALAKELRQMRLRDYSKDLGLILLPQLLGPGDVPVIQLAPAGSYGAGQQQAVWDAALAYYNGEKVDFRQRFGTQTHWMLIGPFANEGATFTGHHAVYPPETSIDLDAEYDGLKGKVRWIEHRQDTPNASVDFAKVFKPTEHVCAYALCYVTSPRQINAQIRLGTNDSGKVWLGGKLVFDYPYEGSALLDREVIPVTLPKGTTPILLKICNGALNWGFVFRITDAKGRALEELRFSVRPRS